MLLIPSLALAASVELNPGDDVGTLTASLGPGDDVLFHKGTYSIPSPLTWTGVGTESNPIRIHADGEVTLELQSGWAVIVIQDSAYMTIEGIHFKGADTLSDGYYAIYSENTDHLTIKDCELGPNNGTAFYADGQTTSLSFQKNEVHDTTGTGIYLGCDDAQCWTQDSTISNNWVHDIGDGDDYGIYLAKGGQGNSIVDNVIYNGSYRGLSIHSTEYGELNTVQGNAIWNVMDIGMYVRGASRVQNNLIFNVTGTGIYLTTNDHDLIDDVVVSHNTVWNTTGYAAYMEYWTGRTGNVFANNALSNINGYGFRAYEDNGVDDAALISHNVVSGLVSGLDSYAGATDPILPGKGDADFEDPEGWNLYPAGGSTLLDAGDAAGFVPETDFNGAPRDGNNPEVGAYEFVGSGNPGWVIQEGFKDTTPVDPNAGQDVGGCCGDNAEDTAKGALLLPLALLRRRRRG